MKNKYSQKELDFFVRNGFEHCSFDDSYYCNTRFVVEGDHANDVCSLFYEKRRGKNYVYYYSTRLEQFYLECLLNGARIRCLNKAFKIFFQELNAALNEDFTFTISRGRLRVVERINVDSCDFKALLERYEKLMVLLAIWTYRVYEYVFEEGTYDILIKQYPIEFSSIRYVSHGDFLLIDEAFLDEYYKKAEALRKETEGA